MIRMEINSMDSNISYRNSSKHKCDYYLNFFITLYKKCHEEIKIIMTFNFDKFIHIILKIITYFLKN